MAVVTGIVAGNNNARPAIGAVESAQTADTPNITTYAYQRSLPRWQKCRDLMLGTEAIRAGGTTYLPQHPNEDDERYAKRQVIAALFNGFARTVAAATGIILDQEPTLGDDMPQQLVDMWENVDGNGTHGVVFARDLTNAGMVDGLAGIVTDYPRANDPRTDKSRASLAASRNGGATPLDAADEAALNLRPYFVLVKADQVVLPFYETLNGRRILTMLILKELATVRDGKYGIRTITRYLVYERSGNTVTYERWEEVAAGGKPVKTEGPSTLQNMRRIPWAPVECGDKIGPNEYKPTLYDLADLNIEHHNIKTGILSLEDLACVPTPVRVGAVPTTNADGTLTFPPLVLGPSNTIEAPATQGVNVPVYWLAPPVDVLDPAMASLESTKAEMGAMGASFLTPQPQQETATAKRMDATAEKANISSVSRAVKDCFELSFDYAAEFLGLKGGSITMGKELTGEGINPQYLAVIVSAYQQEAITLEELRFVLQTGQLPEDFDPHDVVALMAQQAAKEAEAQAVLDATRPQPSVDNPVPAPAPKAPFRIKRDANNRITEIG